METSFYSRGKLLLSGEYAVLDGALALALPTKLGQWMHVVADTRPGLSWEGLDHEGNTWLKTYFEPEVLLRRPNQRVFPTEPTERLLYTLREALALNPNLEGQYSGKKVTTQLEFPRLWGLGTSSTFIANLARWADVNAFELLSKTLGGSGYDIACAHEDGPIFYQRNDWDNPSVKKASFDPDFSDQIWLVYLNQKQDSREGIAAYKARKPLPEGFLNRVSKLSEEFVDAQNLTDFKRAITAHETLLSGLLGIPTVQSRLFPDYPGALKSLGAWGGDFILAAGETDTPEYFKTRGYHTVLGLSALMA